MSDEYERIAKEATTSARRPRDLTEKWAKLTELDQAPPETLERIKGFAATKRITLESLQALGTRVASRGQGRDVHLAWGWTKSATGKPVVTAIKYRHLTTGERTAEPGSAYLTPLFVGNRDVLSVFVAEGETDAARLHGLVGDAASILVLPAGAKAFKPEWAAHIPRGATVYLAHDADQAGDQGAATAARVIGGRAIRVRPPDGANDWCDWDGDRPAFVELVKSASKVAASRVKTYDELLAQYQEERSGDDLEPVRLGFGSIDADIRGISAGQVCGIAARTAVGKTWALASVGQSFSARSDSGALVMSLEMPGVEWAERALAIHTDVAPETVEQWARSGELLDRAQPFLERMRHHMVIDDPISLTSLPAAITDARQRLQVPLRLILIDYLGLLGSEGRDAYERASALGKGLKLIAKEERLSVIVAMQLSRAGGDGSSPVTLEMLRDSGVLEESLDFLLGCWRPGKAQTLTPPDRLSLQDVMRVSILKNRKGADGRTVDLHFRHQSRRLYEPAGIS